MVQQVVVMRQNTFEAETWILSVLYTMRYALCTMHYALCTITTMYYAL
jgi:hypothetical protein